VQCVQWVVAVIACALRLASVEGTRGVEAEQ
jgi:hypothetical protein